MVVGIIIPVIFFGVLTCLIIAVVNSYKRKKFSFIKNNGNYLDGIIIMASYHSKLSGGYRWLWKDSGEITVTANNKIYKITDIDYNDEFKLLEEKLSKNFYLNKQKYIDLNQNFKNNGILAKIHREEINVGIYILDNKVVADLESIKIS